MKRKAIMNLPPTPPKKKGKVFTVQALEKILIMNYWEGVRLVGRYCLNTKSGEYESYLADSGMWRQCKLETLCTGESLYWYDWHKEIVFNSKKDEQLVAQMLSKPANENPFWEIHDRETDYLSNKRETKEYNRKQRILKLMLQVPELPKEAFTWMLHQAGPDYLFYQKESDTWFCSLCMKVSTTEEVLRAMEEQGEAIQKNDKALADSKSGKKKKAPPKIRHNDRVICPGCQKRLIAKKWGEPSCQSSDEGNLFIPERHCLCVSKHTL